MKFFSRFFEHKFTADVVPEGEICVIGDVHGRSDLLHQLLDWIAQAHTHHVRLIFVGDMIDRGEHVAETLELIQSLQSGSWLGKVTALKGNHEAMLLDFIHAPEGTGASWIQHGGTYTMQSYGVPPPTLDPEALSAARDDLCNAIGVETITWMGNLPLFETCGNIFISHAGANPNKALDQQSEADLIWGHPDFLTKTRRDNFWVVHGHYIVEKATAQNGRISVDTGAYATQKLTAALLSKDGCKFLTIEK